MMHLSELRQSWWFLRAELRGQVLLAASLVAALFFLILGLAPNFPLLWNSVGRPSLFFELLGGLIIGIWTSAEWYATVVLAFVSVLSGVNIALVLARSHRVRGAGATGLGSILGLSLTGCPSCATGLLPLFGVTLGAGLPFGGLELSMFGILVLLVALYWNTTAENCRL